MPSLSSKLLILSVISLFGITATSAQNFYKDYRDFLLSRDIKDQYEPNYLRYVNTSIKRLQMVTNRFENKNHYSFFNADTVYLVRISPAMGGFQSEIIWNKKASCYYKFSYYSPNGKRENSFTIMIDASKILGTFTTKFIKTVDRGDTAFYKNYASEHRTLDCTPVQAFMGVINGNKWNFTSFYGDGQALCFDYDDNLKLTNIIKKPPATLHAMVDSLIRNSLHFNVDSSEAAYNENPEKYHNKKPFPLIVLNDEPIVFEYLKKINLNEVKTISILNNRADCIAIFGADGKYGVVTIQTNQKKEY